MANQKKAKRQWGICDKKGWKVYHIYDSKEEAERHLTHPHLYEVREIIA